MSIITAVSGQPMFLAIAAVTSFARPRFCSTVLPSMILMVTSGIISLPVDIPVKKFNALGVGSQIKGAFSRSEPPFIFLFPLMKGECATR
jgi:hypothetical protein